MESPNPMKRTLAVIISAGVLAGALFLCGCSKSANPTSSASSGNSTSSTNAEFASPDSPVDMQIKWTTGRKYPMHIELEQISKTDVPGQPQPVAQDLKLAQDFNLSALKPLDNGGQQLELTFENETMNILLGDRSVLSFDSTQDPSQDTNNPVAPVLRAIIGARIEYFTGPNGEYQRMEGLDELRNRAQANARQEGRGLFDAMFNEDALKQYCAFADSMPGHPVKVGDSWRLKKDISNRIGVLSLNLKYTFKDWQPFNQRNCAHVELSGDISTKSISVAAGAEVDIEKGTISGQFLYDPALDMIVSANNNMNLALKITTRAQTMTSQFTQNSRVALLE
jgi:hypothetical protein